MATAKIETVTKTITTEVDEKVIQLTLTNAEARTVLALAALVWTGGGGDTYKREVFDVKATLRATGQLGYVDSDDYFYVDDEGDVIAKAHKSGDK